jgi:hypothetical protein
VRFVLFCLVLTGVNSKDVFCDSYGYSSKGNGKSLLVDFMTGQNPAVSMFSLFSIGSGLLYK